MFMTVILNTDFKKSWFNFLKEIWLNSTLNNLGNNNFEVSKVYTFKTILDGVFPSTSPVQAYG